MPIKCPKADVLNRRVAGFFRVPCSPADDDGEYDDFFRAFVRLDTGNYIELDGGVAEQRVMELFSAGEFQELDPRPLVDSRLDCIGDTIDAVYIRPPCNEIVLHLHSNRYLSAEDCEDGTILTLEDAHQLQRACPHLLESLRPYFG